MSKSLAAVFFAALALLAQGIARGAFTYQPILLSGQFNPGTSVPISRVATPWINSVGSISVYTQASLSPTGATYHGRPGSLARVVVSGDPVGGGDALRSTSLIETPRITPSGLFGTSIVINGPDVDSTNNIGFYRAALGSVPQVIARTGFPLPGLTTGTLQGFRDRAFSAETAQFAISGFIAGQPGVEAGIWATRNGNLQEIARTGTPAPGLPPGTTFRGEALVGLLPDDTLAFSATLRSPDGTFLGGMFVEQNGQLRKLLAGGDPVPGYPPGYVVRSTSAPRTSKSGIAFYANISPPGTTNVETALFKTDAAAQTVVPVISRGDPLAVAGEFFAGGECIPSFNDYGDSAFHGAVTDTFNNRLGIGFFVKKADGSVVEFARTGRPAPGAGATVFEKFALDAFSINARGELAFRAKLADDRDGLWIAEPDGSVTAIAIENRPFEAAPGDFRIPTSVSGFLIGTSHTGSDALNDRGELVFSLRFTDGSSGAYLVQLPEPSAAAGLVALVVFMRHRRQRCASRTL